jgi:hypothetical protein
LAMRGTRHCTKFPKVERDWLPCGSENETVAYTVSSSSHAATSHTIFLEEGIYVSSSLRNHGATEHTHSPVQGPKD